MLDQRRFGVLWVVFGGLMILSNTVIGIPVAVPQLGMNLAGPADWNTELPFVDVFRMSRPWISQQKDKSWGQGPALSLDEHGWVRRLEPDCWAETLMCTIEGGHYPSGRYSILYDGKGKLGVWNAGTIVSQEAGRMIVGVDSSKGALFLRLLETDPGDYVRNIRVVMPGFEKTHNDNPWHPVFLNRWKGMACLRFMDFMETNNSKMALWSQRPTLQDATFSEKGIALELMIDLSNRLGADPWFCMPHLADDEYIKNFAEMVKAKLDPSRKIYIEYSNEVWNGMFQQSQYAGQEGIKQSFAEKPWEAGWRYTAYRSVQMFRIWEQIFGGTDRLVRILPSQAANPYVSERIVEWQDAYKHADALAIAPYISMNLSPGGKPDAKQVAGWAVEQVLDYLENTALPESIEWIRGNKKIADKYGLKLMTYEGGQHMVGVGGGENIEQLTELLHKANAHPGMADIYAKYFTAWEEAGGDLFCYFSSVGQWSKWGSWGLLQYSDEDPKLSPKFMATMQWARKCGQAVNMPEMQK
ncbi:MAG: hypothetical protein JW828_00130 [Sedimentisphaerales bacterium]|nr:hypothetical protein [Sedimentisphaerales bacterium]